MNTMPVRNEASNCLIAPAPPSAMVNSPAVMALHLTPLLVSLKLCGGIDVVEHGVRRITNIPDTFLVGSMHTAAGTLAIKGTKEQSC
jgi:hypothetical protein